MNIYLGEYFEKYIERQIQSGLYKNASEVIREGLRKLEEEEKLLQAKIDQGLRSKSATWDRKNFLEMAHRRMDQIESS